MAENFYELLGVSEDASTAVIEDAYREEIKQVHPDVSDDVDAGERTKRLNKAKQVLTDEDERARYDRIGHDTYLSGGAGNSGGSTNGDGPAEAGGSSRTAGSTRSDSRNEGRAGGGSYRGRQRSGATAAGSASGTGAGTATGSGRGTGSGSGNTWSGRRGARNGQGPSRSSSGPTWQSARAGRATAGGSAGTANRTAGTAGGAAGSSAQGPSARRQASAGTTDGPNADWSWNTWERTRSWAVREGGSSRPGFDASLLVPTQQSVLLLAVTFFLYPMFVASALYPLFPLVARVLVAVCTVLMFVYLASVPRVAVTVFGLWGVLTPVALVALPGVGLFTLGGVVALSATWIPLALSLLTLSVVDP